MNSRTRIKICGLTRPTDLDAAVACGVDAIGMVFYPPSGRFLDPDRAARLRAFIPAFVDVVALFVNPDPAFVERVIRQVHPDVLQFHGEESADFCTQFKWPYLKSFRVGAPGQDRAAALAAYCTSHMDAHAWLFDSFSPGYGGSGHGFDAGLLDGVRNMPEAPPLILAGGLDSNNVAARIHAVHPFAVDASSRIESAPGIKSVTAMRAFVQAVRAADAAV